MMESVKELLENKGGSYILPFFWQHGESEEVLVEYVDAIYRANIREFCMECRPHPDFLGGQWWHDMDLLMEEAKKRGMKIWLLDDSHFPTGYCNGALKEADPSLRKEYIQQVYVDVHGGTRQVVFRYREAMQEQEKASNGSVFHMPGMEMPQHKHFDTDRVLKALACRIEKGDVLGEIRDISDCLTETELIYDVPEGHWRLFVIYYTQNGGGQTDYMNLLKKDSVKVLLDTVYEPVYARYHDEFGKTFKGFFSDEPLVGNCANLYDDQTWLGHRHMPLPWNEDMEGMLSETLGENWLCCFPLLWAEGKDHDRTGKVRYAYMDAMTKLIRENFSMQIGNWCRSHGVEYIGHMVEDQNRSATVNYMGDYFRGLWGQDMAGIDVIGGGIFPGGENRITYGMPGLYQPDGDFYHFILAKLGASLAQIDPKKKGRTMVELFGAYGWQLGVKDMKYIADHFLVRGVNRFTPHAFSPKAFPDPDCPPHFYAHGENPQFRAFGQLMAYMQRVAHLIDGGVPVIPVALLDTGNASWCGDCLFAEKAARELTENQIDFHLLPPEILREETAMLDEDGLHINQMTYRALVIPRMEFAAQQVAAFCRRASEIGFPVIFVDAKPTNGADYLQEKEMEGSLVSLENLADELRTMQLQEITLCPAGDGMRYYHYRQEKDIYLFANEAMGSVYRGSVELSAKGIPLQYDAMQNCLYPVAYEPLEKGTRISLEVAPWDMKIIVFAEDISELSAATEQRMAETCTEPASYMVSLCRPKEYPQACQSFRLEKPADIGRYAPDFGGVIRYETVFEARKGECRILEIEDAYECVEVWCNEKYTGSCICPPYRFDLTEFLTDGENSLRMEVATTLIRSVQARPDMEYGPFSRKMTLFDPMGIIGKVTV